MKVDIDAFSAPESCCWRWRSQRNSPHRQRRNIQMRSRSGCLSRFRDFMRVSARHAHGCRDVYRGINAAGGIKSLGGAKLKLVVVDCGDTAEKAKSAAQRMVSEYPDMVAVSGSYLSTLTLATSEVTERAHLPMLTLSYSDLITSRDFKYIFQTSATAGSQSDQALPVLIKIAQAAGADPRPWRSLRTTPRRR